MGEPFREGGPTSIPGQSKEGKEARLCSKEDEVQPWSTVRTGVQREGI